MKRSSGHESNGFVENMAKKWSLLRRYMENNKYEKSSSQTEYRLVDWVSFRLRALRYILMIMTRLYMLHR